MAVAITQTCLRVLELPIEAMTYRQIAEHIGVKPKTARDYLRILRQAGMTDKKAIRLKGGRRTTNLTELNARRIQAAEERAREKLRDTRPALCPATWAVYAAVLPPEEMAKWFRPKGDDQ